MLQYFSFFDKKSSSFDRAWPAASVAEAIRATCLGCKDGKSAFSLFPSDFDLYLVADWDHVKGRMNAPTEQGPQFIEHVTACVDMMRKEVSVNG